MKKHHQHTYIQNNNPKDIPHWLEDLDFSKGDGLIPAVIQHDITGKVLMVGYMNKEALLKTIHDGVVCFFSRSRQRLWVKGETSSHYLSCVSLSPDCDHDTLLVGVIPQGPTCHFGVESCFFGHHNHSDSLWQLEHTIASRKQSLASDQKHDDDSSSSYTKRLFAGGMEMIAQKFGEEAIEVLVAASLQTPKQMIEEVADMMYHLLVLLKEKDVEWKDVQAELASRSVAKKKS